MSLSLRIHCCCLKPMFCLISNYRQENIIDMRRIVSSIWYYVAASPAVVSFVLRFTRIDTIFQRYRFSLTRGENSRIQHFPEPPKMNIRRFFIWLDAFSLSHHFIPSHPPTHRPSITRTMNVIHPTIIPLHTVNHIHTPSIRTVLLFAFCWPRLLFRSLFHIFIYLHLIIFAI